MAHWAKYERMSALPVTAPLRFDDPHFDRGVELIDDLHDPDYWSGRCDVRPYHFPEIYAYGTRGDRKELLSSTNELIHQAAHAKAKAQREPVQFAISEALEEKRRIKRARNNERARWKRKEATAAREERKRLRDLANWEVMYGRIKPQPIQVNRPLDPNIALPGHKLKQLTDADAQQLANEGEIIYRVSTNGDRIRVMPEEPQ